MLDPITAIGLSSNILQFVDFAIKLVSTGHEIHSSIHGATVENLDLENTARTLVGLNRHLAKSVQNWSNEERYGNYNFTKRSISDRYIEQIGAHCHDIAKELLDALDKLKVKDGHRKWDSIIQALTTVMAKGKIEALQKRLEQSRSNVNTALLISLKQSVDAIPPGESILARLDSTVDKLKVDILEEIRENRQTGSNDFRVLQQTLGSMSRQETFGRLSNQLVQQLTFQDQDDREFRIAEAHAQTFRWIFDRNGEQQGRPWDNFVSWLEGDEEHLYWITGKAGSGKSTLMKFINNEQLSRLLLKEWSGETQLIVTSYFFWNSGSKHQFSQEGLLRTILSQACKQLPEITPKVLPKRWARSEVFGCDTSSWTLSELTTAFNQLMKLSSEQSFKICMFVDGLDEFDGDLEYLISLFQRAVQFPNVKACLASRPWVVFEEAFLTKPSLKLEDLTYPDIVRYITAFFEDNSGFRALQRREKAYASTLINNIAKKSQGVFLWVSLVVKSLLSGLSNRDRVTDLQRRLDQLPGDLENFYQKIFDSIEPFYVENACQLFQLVATADGRLDVLGLYFADEPLDVCTEQALSEPLNVDDEEEERDIFDSVKRRLNSRCKGLLEVPGLNTNWELESVTSATNEIEVDGGGLGGGVLEFDPVSSMLNPALSQSNIMNFECPNTNGGAESDISSELSLQDDIDYDSKPVTSDHPAKPTSPGKIDLLGRNVTYLHRTVKDFLANPEMLEKIDTMTEDYEPHLYLLNSGVSKFKAYRSRNGSERFYKAALEDVLKYADLAEKDGKLNTDLLDEIGKFYDASKMGNSGSVVDPSEENGPRTEMSKNFLRMIAKQPLCSYVSKKILQGQVSFLVGSSQTPLLHTVITEYKHWPGLCQFNFPRGRTARCTAPSIPLIHGLLEKPCDPNHVVNDQSVWSRLLEECAAVSRETETWPKEEIGQFQIPVLEHWSLIVELFLRANADPRVDRDSQQGSFIRESFGKAIPSRSKELEKLLAQKRKKWSNLGMFLPPPLKKVTLPSREMTSITILNRLDSVGKSEITRSEMYVYGTKEDTIPSNRAEEPGTQLPGPMEHSALQHRRGQASINESEASRKRRRQREMSDLGALPRPESYHGREGF